jgi:hypothetical protein
MKGKFPKKTSDIIYPNTLSCKEFSGCTNGSFRIPSETGEGLKKEGKPFPILGILLPISADS